MSEAEVTLAVTLLKNGRHAEAGLLLRRVLAEAPDHADALQYLGVVARFDGEVDTAHALLTRALALRPGDARTHGNFGNLLVQMDRPAEAEAAFRQALRLDPALTTAYAALAHLKMPGDPYSVTLERLHGWLKPAGYIEIGVESGRTLALALPTTIAIGIDPTPVLQVPLSARTQVYAMTSDAFFATHDVQARLGLAAVDMAFIDGLHLFDQVLRDFINLEAVAAPESVILIHDVLPLDEGATARRPPATSRYWTGDVWKALLALRRHRPDLAIFVIPALPSGLAVVTRLDPASTVLRDRYAAILDGLMATDLATGQDERERTIETVANDWPVIRDRLAALRP